MWIGERAWLNPSVVLSRAAERRDIVEGLVPSQGVTWMYGSSMSFKTFVAMSMAVATTNDADGASWMGRRTENCLVVYVGAEGGLSLHLRRAAAEMEAQPSAQFCLANDRPMLDTRVGQARLRGVIAGLTGVVFSDCCDYDDPEEDLAFEGARKTYLPPEGVFYDDIGDILIVVDTYSQTSGGDDKANVGAYIKGLRDMIDEAAPFRLSFLVIDHATKAGGSYVGSVAKLNDVDSQIEVVRAGSSGRATLYHRKVKDGIESDPLSVELIPKVLPEYTDAYGKPLSTLVVRDGTKAAKIAELAEGKAGVILTLLEDEGGRCEDEVLRRLFDGHASNADIKSESVARAYKRGKENLQESGLIAVEGNVVFAT